jgi:copper chaperone
MSNIELKVDGMSCQNCVRHVGEALRAVPGVQDAQVDLEAGRARVQHDGADVSKLIEALDEAGYDAQVA